MVVMISWTVTFWGGRSTFRGNITGE